MFRLIFPTYYPNILLSVFSIKNSFVVFIISPVPSCSKHFAYSTNKRQNKPLFTCNLVEASLRKNQV